MSDKSLPPGTPNSTVGQSIKIEVPTANLGLVSGTPLVLLMPMWMLLLLQAKEQFDKGAYQAAVVFAHTACELGTETAMSTLIRHRADPVLAGAVMKFISRNCHFGQKRVRQAYSALTGDFPAGDGRSTPKAAWWDKLESSRKLRNDVVHRGVQVLRQDAETCIGAAEACVLQIRDVVSRVVGSTT